MERNGVMNLGRRGNVVILLFVSIFIMSGCSRDEEEKIISYDPDKAPIKIGVCLATQNESTEYGKRQWDGVRMAHQLKPVLDNTLVALIVKQSDEIMGESGIADLIEQEGLCGIIYSAGESGAGNPAPTAGIDDVTITVMTAGGCLPGNPDMQFLKIGSSLHDQARVAALYCLRALNARGAAIVLDQNRSSAVRLASLFSSELIRFGGNIVNIAYVGNNQGNLDAAVTSIMDHNPDIVYIPYAQDTSVEAIALLRAKGCQADIIVTNVLFEQRFLKKGGGSLDGVYLVTDFHPGAVRSERGAALTAQYEKNKKEVGPLETSGALSADAYFLLLELLKVAESAKGFEEALQALSFKETISGITGGNAFERLTKHMHISQIKNGIIRGARLTYRESINPWDSDLKADISAE